MQPVQVIRGESPIILAFPHVGTALPPEVAARLNPEGMLRRDTDWHIDRLYAGLIPGLTTVTATQSRYVIDLNRDPAGTSLYPGQTTTGLIPLTTFDNQPIWKDGCAPGPEEHAHWLAAVHQPYHAALQAEVTRLHDKHGVVVLYDCHSIRSQIPWLFPGILPAFNIGTDNGKTCAPELQQAVAEICAASGQTWVQNGRFRGGWTTRHYADPARGIHTLQMEVAQSSHLASEAPPFDLDLQKSLHLSKTLTDILKALAELAPRISSL